MQASTTHMSAIEQQLLQVCQQVAPTWPLDQLIAVNPWWELKHQPFAEVAARFAALHQIDCLPPVSYSKQLFAARQLPFYAIEQALQEANWQVDVTAFLVQTDHEVQYVAPGFSVLQQIDRVQARDRLPWFDEIRSHVSQFCAWYYQNTDGHQAENADLYQQYQKFTAADLGLDLLLGAKGLHQAYADLPSSIPMLLAEADSELHLSTEQWSAYGDVLLRQLNGWASWGSYLRWQAGLQQQTPTQVLDLLAIMLGWELAILRYLALNDAKAGQQVRAQWFSAITAVPQHIAYHRQQQQAAWIWWRAAEIHYQDQLLGQLLAHPACQQQSPQLQAVFCIDVRSEPLRRQLEQQSPAIQTLGFAGFFGLPIEIEIAGTPLKRPQLPGLLAPAITVHLEPAQTLQSKQRVGIWQRQTQQAFTSFSLVEATGWLKSIDLLKHSLWPQTAPDLYSVAAQPQQWRLSKAGQPVSVREQAELALAILNLMGLREFAPTVLVVGHGSQSCNNLHAGGLECGACGGQSGELNSKVLVSVLNNPEVRAQLQLLGCDIPAQTRFVAALHNTTTDQLICADEVPEQVKRWLDAASLATAQERELRWTGIKVSDGLLSELRRRGGDWSETRPEWGLANNAAFVIAPRQWTRQLDLAGRVFLHDYQQAHDAQLSTLELLLTAPMVVTNWINMQYNASVTAPTVFGSGNKVLHNAVAGHVGVFEGQGGDLRIGLAKQSVHNGERFMHQPLRLTVVVAASTSAIDHILAKHPQVRVLVDNGWLHLWQWQQGEGLQQRTADGWQELR